jgi:hypothetical protein
VKKNNVTGKFPATFLSKLSKLKIVNLAGNNLSGIMAGITHGVDNVSMFFEL